MNFFKKMFSLKTHQTTNTSANEAKNRLQKSIKREKEFISDNRMKDLHKNIFDLINKYNEIEKMNLNFNQNNKLEIDILFKV